MSPRTAQSGSAQPQPSATGSTAPKSKRKLNPNIKIKTEEQLRSEGLVAHFPPKVEPSLSSFRFFKEQGKRSAKCSLCNKQIGKGLWRWKFTYKLPYENVINLQGGRQIR